MRTKKNEQGKQSSNSTENVGTAKAGKVKSVKAMPNGATVTTVEMADAADADQPKFKRLKDIKVTKTKDPKEMVGKYLVKNVTRSWTEDCEDEDTGEMVPMKRCEILFQATSNPVSASDASQIQFFLKSYDDVDAVVVSDERLPRVALRGYGGTVPMLLKLHHLCADAVYGVRAMSVEDAIAICTNYGALYCDLKDTVYVVGMKMLGCPVYGDENKEVLNAALRKEFTLHHESDPCWYGYYKVDGQLKYYDMVLNKKNTIKDSVVVVLAREAGEAKEKGLKALEEQWQHLMIDAGDCQSSVQKVSPVRIDYMVPEWYSKEWYKKEKEEEGSGTAAADPTADASISSSPTARRVGAAGRKREQRVRTGR